MTRTDGGPPAQARDPDTVEREDGEGEGANGGFDPDGGELLELAIVVASVLLLVATLGYVGWQATVTTADGVPTATVEAIEPMPASDDDRLRVTVRLDNRRGTGLSSVQVGVECGDAGRSLAFEHVPAGGSRTGTVVCPAGTEPIAEVVTWTRI